MANDINDFVDNMHLNISNSFTHMLNTENSDELNVIQYSPYITDDLLLQSRENRKRLSIVILNCQSLHAKFDYIRLLEYYYIHYYYYYYHHYYYYFLNYMYLYTIKYLCV